MILSQAATALRPLAPPASEIRVRSDAANEPIPAPAATVRNLYHALMQGNGGTDAHDSLRAAASAFLRRSIDQAAATPSDMPADPQALSAWLQTGVAATGEKYQAYLARRKAGQPREFFTSRSHCLNFLRTVAPTKLVDGAWLYGLLPHWQNPKFFDLVHTYVEELGDGEADKNHVLIYRQLLQSHGIVDWEDQPDAHYVQGAIQLALATCADEFLPEVVGFNLGYEQLPLHLLITAYELNELGIDPTYFSLHVTVDNAASGHAQRAIRATADALPAVADPGDFWLRVAAGYRLNNIGLGTTSAIAGFDADAELLRVLGSKAMEGRVAHSDYCRIEGRSVNEWLACEDGVTGFVGALERKGWIMRNEDPRNSRFWQLLQGEHADMFGVFGDYELQVIYDWIRGEAAMDGAHFPSGSEPSAPRAPRSFRQQRRQSALRGESALALVKPHAEQLDTDAAEAARQLSDPVDPQSRIELLLKLMGPANHWSMAGLEATRRFSRVMLRAAY